MPPDAYADRPASLKGKVAIVTGSTQGLGEAIARLFASRGIDGVVITGRNVERGQKIATEISQDVTNTTTAVFVQADLSNLDDVDKIIQAADDHFSRLDILVNSAALTERCSIWDTTPEQYDRIMAVNTRAPFFLMQGAVRLMERDGIAGSIINISSTA
jgi:NAD(P)-dependent dehydrogenase (short-subunit alcohol dehydrogenase family)